MVSMQAYGEQHRAGRKLIHAYIGTREAMKRLEELEEVENRRFLLRVLRDPTQLNQHIRTCVYSPALPLICCILLVVRCLMLPDARTTGAIILKLSYGYTIEPTARDPLVDLADRAILNFSLSAAPGAWLVDILPGCASSFLLSPFPAFASFPALTFIRLF